MTGSVKQRILLAYERQGPSVWLGHLDMMRLFERAFSRASWPLSWTDDAFNPRPEIVFALPVALGIETRSDPLEVSLRSGHQAFNLEEGLSTLRQSLPGGVKIVSSQALEEAKRSLMARVTAATYQLEAPGLGEAFQRVFKEGEPVLVTRIHKKKKQTIDLASRLISLDELDHDGLVLTGGAGSSGHLRLDLLLQALVEYGGLDQEAAQGARIVRLAVLLDD